MWHAVILIIDDEQCTEEATTFEDVWRKAAAFADDDYLWSLKTKEETAALFTEGATKVQIGVGNDDEGDIVAYLTILYRPDPEESDPVPHSDC